MKPNDFYAGTTEPNGTIITGDITSIADPATDYMDAYYMGYISFYDIPETLKLHKMEQISGGLVITDQTDRNHAWGFCKTGLVSGISYSNVLVPYNGIFYNKRSGTTTPKFYNSIKMCNFANANWLSITLRYIFIPESELDANDTAYNERQSNGSYTMYTASCTLPIIGATIGGVDYSGFNDFMAGDYQLDFGTAALNGDTVQLQFSFVDFGTDENPTCRREITAGGANFVLFAQITSFYFYDYGTYTDGVTNYQEGCVPFIEFDNLIENEGLKTMVVGTCSDFARIYVNLDSINGNYIVSSGIDIQYIISGWYQGNFYIENNDMYGGSTGSEYWYASQSPKQYPGFGRDGIIRGRHITDYRSAFANDFYIYTFMRPFDIWLCILTYHKIDTLHKDNATVEPSTTYNNDYSVTIYITNIPTQDRVQEDLADITPKLMQWQLPGEDIQDDPFDIADMPIDPVPPPTPEDDSDSGGDNIAPYDFTNTPLSAANNFTTLYALTTAQVAAFGAIMWASLSDPNFWHSVGVVFENDFSINPADMMRYFNFLRYYPFDLTPYSSQYISGIYIGRSTIPIQFPAGTEYPRRANRNLIQIKGGEVTAELPAQYNTNDFLVSDPATQITVHVPFCGVVQLPASECYGKKLYLNYVIDLQSGAIQATISVQSDTFYIVATLAGTCGASVQITANNNIEFLTRIATVATGGISSAATMATRGAQVAGAEGAIATGVVGALTGTVSALAGLPPVTVHRQGNTTGFANYGGDPQAYITIQTPKRSTPASYARSTGYISNKQAKIGDLSGYTEMINPDVSGITAHADELTEIYKILQTGFYA